MAVGICGLHLTYKATFFWPTKFKSSAYVVLVLCELYLGNWKSALVYASPSNLEQDPITFLELNMVSYYTGTDANYG